MFCETRRWRGRGRTVRFLPHGTFRLEVLEQTGQSARGDGKCTCFPQFGKISNFLGWKKPVGNGNRLISGILLSWPGNCKSGGVRVEISPLFSIRSAQSE